MKRFNFVFINPEAKSSFPIEYLPEGVARKMADALTFSTDNDWFNRANIFVEKSLRAEMGDNNPTMYKGMVNLKQIADSVQLVCSRQQAKINDLYIVGHGSRGGMRVNDNWLSLPTVDSIPESHDNAPDYRPHFRKIGRYTDDQSCLYLFACGTGGNKELIATIKDLVGCKVFSISGIATPLQYFINRSVNRLMGR